MSFKNLEERFNANVNKLYAGAKTKFDNGRPSKGVNDDPLIVRKPGDGYFGAISRAGGRALPVSSALQDVKRLTLFTVSVRGITFLAKQQLLQTGNTFEQTRLINPVFAIGNAVPFLHLRRHLRPLNTLLKKTDTSYANVKKLGQLQKSTYDGFTQNANKGVKGLLKKIAGPITSTISAFTAKKNVGEEFGYNETGWKQTRPELGKRDRDYVVSVNASKFQFGGSLNTLTFTGQRYGALPKSPGAWDGNYTTYIKFTDGKSQWSLGSTNSDDYQNTLKTPIIIDETVPVKNTVSDKATEFSLNSKLDDSYIPDKLKTIREDYQADKQTWFEEITGGAGIMPYLKYFTGDVESITDGRQFDPTDGVGTNARDLSRPNNIRKKISYIKDPSNTETSPTEVKTPYSYINNNTDVASGGWEDPVTVSFAMGNQDPIRFRAFITELQQSATPEYKSYQYVGRMEKFINYTGVQRDISFKLGVIAFSKDELDGVWRRINYLTGLVYPYGFNRGIFQPNIVRLTIGNVYVDQPGYVTSLNTSFNQLAESWELDIGKQVPISALMDIKFVLIEKASRTANSPFYGITENITGFNKNIPTPEERNPVTTPTQPPGNDPIPTLTDRRFGSNVNFGIGNQINRLQSPLGNATFGIGGR